ncbi:MAG: DUF3568 family protein [Candidatus Omnitrophota bacterium]
MKKYPVFCLVFGLLFAGCAPLIVGGAVGVVGGYAISRDTVAGETDKDYEVLWESSLEVANAMGIVKKHDRGKGSLQFNIGTSNVVVISLEKLTAKTTRIKVSARKHHFPDLKTAEKVFIRIMDLAK